MTDPIYESCHRSMAEIILKPTPFIHSVSYCILTLMLIICVVPVSRCAFSLKMSPYGNKKYNSLPCIQLHLV